MTDHQVEWQKNNGLTVSHQPILGASFGSGGDDARPKGLILDPGYLLTVKYGGTVLNDETCVNS